MASIAEALRGLPILSFITFLPLVGAVILAFAPTRSARQIALTTALITWVVSLVLAAGFQVGLSGFQCKEQAGWISLFGIQYKLGLDGLSLAMIPLTTTLTW